MYFEYGIKNIKSFMELPFRGNVRDNYSSQCESYIFGYEHTVIHNPKITISFDINNLSLTATALEIHDPNSSFAGGGTGITSTKDYTLGIRYSKEFKHRRFNIDPGLFLKYVIVKNTWPEDLPQLWIEDKPYYVQFHAKSFPGKMIIPEFRLNCGVRFLWRFHIYFDYGYAFGYKKQQEMNIKYLYNGIRQPDSKIYVNGTEISTRLGLKLDFFPSTKRKILN